MSRLRLIRANSETAIPFCEEFLTEERVTPYSFIRDMMHIFSAAVENRRRKTTIVSWRDDDTMVLQQQTIHIHKFRTLLLGQLQLLEKFFHEKLLFGGKTSEMGITIDFDSLQDSTDITTRGYSPVLGSLNGNSDSEKFMDFLLSKKVLLAIENSKLVWNIEEAESWTSNIYIATLLLFVLIHVTQGSPARITEEIYMQICNTLFGRRHLFALNGYATLATWSNYWKGAQISGKFKEILRVMPCRVAKLLLILLRIIRPVEVLYLLRHRIPFDESERERVVVAYSSSLWAALGSPISANVMYESVSSFFRFPSKEPIFNFPFGVRLYRQFAAAVQKRHLHNISPKYTKTLADAGTQAGDLQAGHTSQTSNAHYAREEKMVGVDSGFRDHYITYSLAWHKFWGLDGNNGLDL